MRTRRDQVQAYRFVTRRLISAMLSGEPETTQLPMRRLFMAVIGSTMVAAVVLAAVGVYGLMHPGGNQSWQQDNTLVIENESGARYVYLGGKLLPVLNYASARLVLGAGDPVQKSVARASLAGTPRGRTLGIAGAPDALPDPKALLGLPWSVCSMPKVAGTAELATQLVIGSALPGGAPLQREALVVTAGTSTYLLWNDRRLRIASNTVLTALNLTGSAQVPVGAALIDGITAGPDLAAPVIPNAGSAGKPVAGAASKIGAVYSTGGQFYVMLAEGLAAVHEVSARLLLAARGDKQAIEVSASGVADLLLPDRRVEPEGLPETVPTVRNVEGSQPAVCAAFRGDTDHPVTVEVYAKAPDQFSQTRGEEAVNTGRDSVRTADRVLLAGGHGALVQEQPSPGAAATGTVYLVTDLGIKFALADGAQAALGYGAVTPGPVPAALLALVPTGPALDPVTARQFTSAMAGPTPTASPSALPPPSPSPPAAPPTKAAPTPTKPR